MKLRKTGLAAKIIIFVIAIYALVSLLSLHNQMDDYKSQLTSLTVQIQQQRETNEELQAALDAYGDQSGIESIARNDLGLVEKDEIIFYDVSR